MLNDFETQYTRYADAVDAAEDKINGRNYIPLSKHDVRLFVLMVGRLPWTDQIQCLSRLVELVYQSLIGTKDELDETMADNGNTRNSLASAPFWQILIDSHDIRNAFK